MATKLSLIPPDTEITAVAGDSLSLSIAIQNADTTAYPTIGKTLVGEINPSGVPRSHTPSTLTLASSVEGTIVWTMTPGETVEFTGNNRFRIAVINGTTEQTVLVGTLILRDVV